MSSKSTLPHIPQIYATRSDTGCVREHNEDSFAAKSPLFVVADGMGGHEAGEVASELAINAILERIPESADPDALAAAVCAANDAVIQGAIDGTGKPGMGTTMTAALIYDDNLIIAQVGDSRAYLLHDGVLQRITRDHSLVADLIEQGRLTEDGARYHPQRSVITRALGSDPNMEPDIYVLQIVEGDRLLLCSDGLTSMIEDDPIGAILSRCETCDEACDELVNEALAAGGLDNVTVVVIDPMAELPEEDTQRPDEGVPQRKSISEPAPPKPQKPKKPKGRRAPLIGLIVCIALVIGAIAGFYAYAQNCYYIIAEEGYVCIYKGLPGSVGPFKVSWLEETTTVAVADLPAQQQTRLESGVAADSLDDAHSIVDNYRADILKQTTAQNAAKAQAEDAKDAEDASKTEQKDKQQG